MTYTLIENIDLVTLSNVEKDYGLLLNGSKIESVFPMTKKPTVANAKIYDGHHAWALAGLMDLHIHGTGGFGPEQNTPEALWALSDELARHGVTSFCPTLYCARPEEMKKQIRSLLPALGQEKGARILGFHLEGPFISPQKPGVMKPQDISPADVRIMEELYEAAEGKIACMTLAPELENIAPVVEFCLRHNVVPQAGHTNATYEEFCRGIDMGIKHATHAFNAMSPFTQREPGASGAVLFREDVSCEIIADGVHIHPHLVSFLHRVKPAEKIILVTDALTPTQQEKGPFIANGDEVIFEGGVWRRKTDRVIAGSALTMIKGIKNLVDWGYDLSQAVRCASANPAALLAQNTRGQLLPGFEADITLLAKDFTVQDTFIGGKQIAR